MMDKNALRAAIVKKGYTQAQVADFLGITPKTFSMKMKKGSFGIIEAEIMIDKLSIDDPSAIFFAEKVT